MSSKHERSHQTKCDVCGDRLDAKSGESVKVMEIPYYAIEDMKKIDVEIANQLLQNDGRLVYHSNCKHPIQEYMPGSSERIKVGEDTEHEDPREQIKSCPVCNIPVVSSADECGRCGKTID